MLGDELSYLLEVLNIGDGETEEQLDERLKLEAKKLGVDVDRKQNDAHSVRTHASEYSRRSESLDSRASQSTGLTSHYSDLSRDLPNRHGRLSHPTLSFRDYDAFLAKGVPNGRHSIAFSPSATPEGSVFSLPLSRPPSPQSSPRRHFRRLRNLSMLRLHRNDSLISLTDGCPHCPLDTASRRRAIHKLPCGHRLCTQALRNTVKSATESTRGSIPSCCSRPIPGSLVELIMSQEEQNALLEKLEQWDDAASSTPSVDSSRRGSIATYNLPTVFCDFYGRLYTDIDQPRTISATVQNELQRITELPEYKDLLISQAGQRDRFLTWASTQRNLLTATHATQRKDILSTHEAAAEDLIERHVTALSEAEDKQIIAEAALLENHLLEKFSADTALRHMEAYCAGTLSNGDAHGRTISETDIEHLETAKRDREMMQGRHFSAINVLRGEQGRRIKLRKQRQERELQELARQQRREELEFERKCTAELGKFEAGVESKRRKVEWRWELQMAILAKRCWEGEEEMDDSLRLPTAEWSEMETEPIGPGKTVPNGAEALEGELDVERRVMTQMFNMP